MPIEWQDTYATGIDRVDCQHKRLFEWVNKLETQLENEVTLAQTQEILDFLSSYTRTHFTFEEMCMHIHACPAAQRNRDAHDGFIAAVESFQARARGGDCSRAFVKEIFGAAGAWLKSHICKVDNELRGTSPQW
jgi:hemerythrin-like metal-binding protein